MATVREGNKAVLLIVDVQVGVVHESWDAPRIIENVARAVERARAEGVPVIWVQHASEELTFGSTAWQWVPELLPAEDELLIHKQFNSAFEQTALDEELAKRGATHIALAGAQTNWCIRATAYGALERGYDVTPKKEISKRPVGFSNPLGFILKQTLDLNFGGYDDDEISFSEAICFGSTVLRSLLGSFGFCAMRKSGVSDI